MLIGQLWANDISIPPIPLYKDELLQMFWTRIPTHKNRIPVRLLNNKEALVGNSKFEILLFHENKSK